MIKAIKDLVLWLGEFTLLPGEGSARERLKRGALRIRANRKDDGKVEEKAPGFLGDNDRQDPEKQEHHAQWDRSDGLTGALEKEELDQEREANDRGDLKERDIHHYHYLLVKEIRSVMKDLNESPPRKYAYHEWAWFLKLMGEEENSGRSHRKAVATSSNVERGNRELQQAGINDDDSNKEHHEWSWLGARSPLMGETEEAEWVLERLSETLEKELKKQRDEKRRASPGEDEPAILSPTSDFGHKSSQVSEDTINKALDVGQAHPVENV